MEQAQQELRLSRRGLHGPKIEAGTGSTLLVLAGSPYLRVSDSSSSCQVNHSVVSDDLLLRNCDSGDGKIVSLPRRSYDMTPEERVRMNSLCVRIQDEKNPQHFAVLLQELDEVIARKQRRFPQNEGVLAFRRRSRPWKTVSGFVQKIISGGYRTGEETVEIRISEAEDLFREIRIENKFSDVDGQPVALKDNASVELTFEADAKDTIKRGSDSRA